MTQLPDEFHPAAATALLSILQSAYKRTGQPISGAYPDGELYLNTVQFALNERGEVLATVFEPPDFADPARPKNPPVDLELTQAVQEWLRAMTSAQTSKQFSLF